MDGLYWDLTGGSGNLILSDPNGAKTTIPVTIGGGKVTAPWTAVGPQGVWTRAWDLTDATGVRQISEPLAFALVSSPA